MESDRESSISGFTNSLAREKSEYTVLVPLQDMDVGKTLLPPAIRAANRHDGKIILLNIIEIPYQLPPSEAEQFTLEREFKLQYARQIIETAGCDGQIMVRIAHRIPYAIKQLASSLDIDLIIMQAEKKGLWWAKKISLELYTVKSNLLAARNNADSHFNKVILTVDDPLSARSMMEHATYLLESEEGTIHIIPDYSPNNKKSTLRKLRSIVDEFNRQNPWFAGKTVIHQLQPKSAARNYLNEMYHKGKGSTGVLFPYSPGKKSRAGTWLSDEAEELNLPVFLSKVGRVEPGGIDQLTNRLTNWMGITS